MTTNVAVLSSRIRLRRPSRVTLMAYADSRVIAWALLLITALLVWLAFWPGLIAPDDNQTIYQAGINVYTNWWTPFGGWLLHWWQHLGLGLGGVFAVGTTVMVCGTYLCGRFCFSRVPAAVVAFIICLTPPIYATLSALSRDMFYLGFTLLGFGLFGRLVRGGNWSRAGAVWLGIAAFAAEVMGYLCRQNGLACVFALLLAMAFWWRSKSSRLGPSRRWAFALSAVVAAAVATAAVGLTTAGLESAAGVHNVESQRFTYVYDLASISVMSNHDRFPSRVVNQPHPGWVSPPDSHQAALKKLFDPENVITLYPNNAAGTIDFFNTSTASREDAVLRKAWIKAILAEPLDYIWTRLRLVGINLGFWRGNRDAFIPLLLPTNFGYPLVFSGNYGTAARYIVHFVGPHPVWFPLDVQWTWVVLLIIAMWFLVRRSRSLAWYWLMLPIAFIVNDVVLGAAAQAGSFRYVMLEVPAAILAVAYLAGTFAVPRARCQWLLDPRFVALARPSSPRRGGDAQPVDRRPAPQTADPFG